MAFLARIRIYPIKALDPAEVSHAALLGNGPLEHDREFALFDKDGKFINGKRCAAVHQVRAEYAPPDFAKVILRASGASQRFDLFKDRIGAEAWLSNILRISVAIRHDPAHTFPDDTEAPGPTVIGTATLETVAEWFSLEVESVRRRFRANLEIGGVPPFWEDRLYGENGTFRSFKIGDVTIEGSNPCQRCAVPSRDPLTGKPIEEFQTLFAAMRQQTLPPWAETSRFNHYYRLAVNTRVPAGEAGKVLKTGDGVTV